MTGIFLYISDGALREALIEQIKAARWETPCLADTSQALLKQIEKENGEVLIIPTRTPIEKQSPFPLRLMYCNLNN